MYAYELLEPECFYLVQEKENEGIILLQVKVKAGNCLFVVKYKDDIISEWKRKTDPIFDIVELLGDEDVKNWKKIYYNNEDAFYEGDAD